MFKCGLCQTQSKPGEPGVRIVTETREVVYPYIEDAHEFVEFETGRTVIKDDPGGRGLQIAKEVLACQACASREELSRDAQGVMHEL
jgi:hypothetical protein